MNDVKLKEDEDQIFRDTYEVYFGHDICIVNCISSIKCNVIVEYVLFRSYVLFYALICCCKPCFVVVSHVLVLLFSSLGINWCQLWCINYWLWINMKIETSDVYLVNYYCQAADEFSNCYVKQHQTVDLISNCNIIIDLLTNLPIL